MSRLVARIKILPAEADTDLNRLVNTLNDQIPKGMELKAHAPSPYTSTFRGSSLPAGRGRSDVLSIILSMSLS